jgi:pilus assembly protein CpaC
MNTTTRHQQDQSSIGRRRIAAVVAAAAALALGTLGVIGDAHAQATQPAAPPPAPPVIVTPPPNGNSATAPTTAPAGDPVLQGATKPASNIDVTVGESRMIDAPWPVKKVAVADPEVADVDATSPTRVQVRGRAIGVTEIALEGDQGQLWRARLAVNADTARLQHQLKTLFPSSSLQVSQVDDVVVVKGVLARTEDAAHMRQLLTLSKVQYLDLTSVAGLQQVQLQVKVAEVSRTAIRMLGVNAFYGGERWFGGVQLGSSAGPFTPMNVGLPQGSPIPGQPATLAPVGVPPSATLFAGFPNSDLQVFLQALAENQYLRLLAEPTLVARSGQTAHFLAGGEFPLPVSQLSGNETQISIEYKEFGIRLQFTPTVLGDGRIELKVKPEVSELSDVGAVVVLGTRVPSLLTRRVETTLELQSGQTFAIAGLIDQTDSARVSKVPGMGDLPILGPLFRSVRYSREDTEMVVLVTASLVEPTSKDLNPPLPGSFHVEPNDWELYIEGRIEGKSTVRVAPAQRERLKRIGLDQLQGPGAWATYEDNGTLAGDRAADKKK